MSGLTLIRNCALKKKFSHYGVRSFSFFVNKDEDKNVYPILETLQRELVEKGAYLNPKVSVEFIYDYDLSLVANKRINKYDVIAKIPRTLCTEAETIDELSVNVHKDFISKDKTKSLAPHLKYLKYLYQYGNIPLFPITYSDDHEAMQVNAFYPTFEPAELLKQIREKKAYYRAVGKAHNFKLDRFLLNQAIVESRTYHLEEGGLEPAIMSKMIEINDIERSLRASYEGTISELAKQIDPKTVLDKPSKELLIPFVDFLNHGPDQDDCLMIYNQTKEEFHAVSMCNISAGSQIFVDYGTRCDAMTMFMQYGIIPPKERGKYRPKIFKGDEETVEEPTAKETQELKEAKAKDMVIDAIKFIHEYRKIDGSRDVFIPM